MLNSIATSNAKHQVVIPGFARKALGITAPVQYVVTVTPHRKIILDPNIIIDHLRLKGNDSIQINLINNHLDDSFSISTITIQELFAGASTLHKSPLYLLNQTLSELDILTYTQEVAELAGKITRD